MEQGMEQGVKEGVEQSNCLEQGKGAGVHAMAALVGMRIAGSMG